MRIIAVIFIIVLPFYVCTEAPGDIKNTLNVVLFFTHVDTESNALQMDTMDFLNFNEATRVKHNSDEHADNTDLKRDSEKCSVHCKKLLKDSLMTLTRFCHTVMKMKTAVASISTKEMTNDIQEPEATHGRIQRSDSPNNIVYEVRRNEQYPDNTLPPEKKKIKSNTNNVITGTKHTEVFQIRMKRSTNNIEDEAESAKKKDITVKIVNDVPSDHSNKHSWDVLDIMKHVRYSFLGNMFESTLQNRIKADQEDDIDMSKIGKEKQDPGLFNLVKSTLETLQDPLDASFLMVIFGGHLNAIADKNSPIVQSIKHVIEHTECNNTLIIVTGSCATEREDPEKEEGIKSSTMPVYAKGPKSNMLSECGLLYDIPLTIRKILEVHCGAGFHFPESIGS